MEIGGHFGYMSTGERKELKILLKSIGYKCFIGVDKVNSIGGPEIRFLELVEGKGDQIKCIKALMEKEAIILSWVRCGGKVYSIDYYMNLIGGDVDKIRKFYVVSKQKSKLELGKVLGGFRKIMKEVEKRGCQQ